MVPTLVSPTRTPKRPLWPWLALLGLVSAVFAFAVVYLVMLVRPSPASAARVGESAAVTSASAPPLVEDPTKAPPATASAAPKPTTKPVATEHHAALAPPPRPKRMSGSRINTSSANFQDCEGSDALDRARALIPAADLCFAAAQLVPPEHEERVIELHVERNGEVSTARVTSAPTVLSLDACLAMVYEHQHLTKGACTAQITLVAECTPGGKGRCD